MRTTISLLLCLSAFSLQGQEFRIGYINPDSVIASLPEVQLVANQLIEYEKQLQYHYQSRTTCYPIMKLEPSRWAELDSIERKQMEGELAELEAEMAAVAAQVEAKYEQRRASLMQPIYERFADEVNKVASELTLDFIVHTDLILYGKENAVDITAEVLKRLK